MKQLIVSILFFTATSQAQFVIPFTVSDSGPITIHLAIGVLPGAHECLDPADQFNGYQEAEIPPPPPGYWHGIRLLNPHRPMSPFDPCYGFGCYVDFRPAIGPGQEDTFYVAAETDDIAILQWGSGLGAYVSELTLVDTATNGSLFSVNMLTAQSFQLPQGHIRCKILMRTLLTQFPIFSASPGSLNFGTVPREDTIIDSILVTNSGETQLDISGVAINGSTDFTVIPGGGVSLPPLGSHVFRVTFHPTVESSQTADLVFTSNAPSSPDTVFLSGTAIAPEPIYFLTLPPETLVAVQPGTGAKFLKPEKRGKNRYPNWANLRDETVAQGGFRPGTSESDSAGGMRIGLSFMERRNPGDPAKPNWKPIKEMAKTHCWVRIGKWSFKKSVGGSADAIPKTLRSMGSIFHDGPSRGLDSTGEPGDAGRKPLKGELKKLEPKKTSNRLFAELVALKLNIAMSALGKTPHGLGELRYRDTLNFLNDLEVREIARRVDIMLTSWQAYDAIAFTNALSAVAAINRACAGPLDTLGNWEQPLPGFPHGILRVHGAVNVYDVACLRVPPDWNPLRLAAASGEVEPEEEFGEDDGEDLADVPGAVRLYQNYPNPFNPSTTFGFRLNDPSRVRLTVYDVLGREVARVLDGEEFDEGYQEVTFLAGGLASGVYFYTITGESIESGTIGPVRSGKMILLK